MHPRLAHWPVAGVLVAGVLMATIVCGGCSGDATKTPTVATTNFAPTAVLQVGDRGQLQFLLHVVTAEGSVPAGSVLLVANAGKDDHRLQASNGSGTTVFDTGTLQPGDETTVVLAEAGRLTLRDVPTGREVQLEVTPRT
jgi:hypothetical protein